jgi:hypothetical protein
MPDVEVDSMSKSRRILRYEFPRSYLRGVQLVLEVDYPPYL